MVIEDGKIFHYSLQL